MANDTPERFMQALQQVERTKDVEPLVQLFADDAELRALVGHRTEHGRDGARQFWREYLSAFQDVHSDFTAVHRGEDFATLEWQSNGTLPSGEPLTYRGVSLLELRDGQVSGFRTYYDSAAFLPQGAKHAGA